MAITKLEQMTNELLLITATQNVIHALVIRACNDYIICKRALLGLVKDGQVHYSWGRIRNTQKTLDECIDFLSDDLHYLYKFSDPSTMSTSIIKYLDKIVENIDPNSKVSDVF